MTVQIFALHQYSFNNFLSWRFKNYTLKRMRAVCNVSPLVCSQDPACLACPHVPRRGTAGAWSGGDCHSRESEGPRDDHQSFTGKNAHRKSDSRSWCDVRTRQVAGDLKILTLAVILLSAVMSARRWMRKRSVNWCMKGQTNKEDGMREGCLPPVSSGVAPGSHWWGWKGYQLVLCPVL